MGLDKEHVSDEKERPETLPHMFLSVEGPPFVLHPPNTPEMEFLVYFSGWVEEESQFASGKCIYHLAFEW